MDWRRWIQNMLTRALLDVYAQPEYAGWFSTRPAEPPTTPAYEQLRRMLGTQHLQPVAPVQNDWLAGVDTSRFVLGRSTLPANVDPQLLELRKAIARTAGKPSPEQKRFLMKLAERLAQRYNRPAEAIYEAEMNRYRAGIAAGIAHPEWLSNEQYEEAVREWVRQQFQQDRERLERR